RRADGGGSAAARAANRYLTLGRDRCRRALGDDEPRGRSDDRDDGDDSHNPDPLGVPAERWRLGAGGACAHLSSLYVDGWYGGLGFQLAMEEYLEVAIYRLDDNLP